MSKMEALLHLVFTFSCEIANSYRDDSWMPKLKEIVESKLERVGKSIGILNDCLEKLKHPAVYRELSHYSPAIKDLFVDAVRPLKLNDRVIELNVFILFSLYIFSSINPKKCSLIMNQIDRLIDDDAQNVSKITTPVFDSLCKIVIEGKSDSVNGDELFKELENITKSHYSLYPVRAYQEIFGHPPLRFRTKVRADELTVSLLFTVSKIDPSNAKDWRSNLVRNYIAFSILEDRAKKEIYLY